MLWGDKTPAIVFILFFAFAGIYLVYIVAQMRRVAKLHHIKFRAVRSIASNPFAYPAMLKDELTRNPLLKGDVDRLYKIIYWYVAIFNVVFWAALGCIYLANKFPK